MWEQVHELIIEIDHPQEDVAEAFYEAWARVIHAKVKSVYANRHQSEAQVRVVRAGRHLKIYLLHSGVLESIYSVLREVMWTIQHAGDVVVHVLANVSKFEDPTPEPVS